MLVFLIILPLIITDQLAKFIVLKNLQPGESLPVIKNFFHISVVCNKGLAFGLFSQIDSSIFLCISFVAIILLFLLLSRKVCPPLDFPAKGREIKTGVSPCFVFEENKGEGAAKIVKSLPPKAIFLSLILGGAIGNLVDRIRLGFVIDFLDFRIWPVFNIADSAITIGTVLLVLQILKHRPKGLMTNIKIQNPNKIQISNY